MGLEGAFGARYWGLVSLMIPESYAFPGRVRRGAVDLVNSLLNYGYGILYSQALTALTRAGLNATCGFLHAGQGNKPVLSYDLVEEFRAPVVDRAVFSMLNRRVRLVQEESGLLDKDTRKRVAGSVYHRLGGEAVYRGRRETIKNILLGQAAAIRDTLCGKRTYKPFLCRW
jgi:CRISPR-associated protein Cas1